MKELVYKFQNPYNSCEKVYYHPATKQHYILMPSTPYSMKLCTCTPCRGYYEADCPVRGGLGYKIDGKEVTTEADGEIIDRAKKEEYDNTEILFYQVKPEHANDPNYEMFSHNAVFRRLFDYMIPDHFDKIFLKRKEVYCIFGTWHKQEADHE